MRALALVLLLAACGSKEAPAADASPPVEVRKDGRVRIGDKFEAVAPRVIHEARMDLFVSCRAIVDQATADGHKDVPLCYDPAPRGKDAVKVIRIEHRAGASVDAMRQLAEAMEASHFVVETSGATFQLLDLGYAERREGANRGDEIRILAMGGKTPRGAAAQADALAAALSQLYPAARIEQLDVEPKGKP